ncbi:MAG: hypothetical protein LBM96_07005 [Methanobrevibacter sp.]|jgi:hypothetical protein|nr:hypothetical protein [Candidatus Methanoflexus mossambicus]
MENKKSNKLDFEERQIMRRNRKRNKIRFIQGIKQLFLKKRNIIIFAIFILGMTFVWFNRSVLLNVTPKSLEFLFKILIDILYWIIFITLISAVFMWFGKPKNAQEIEDDIKDLFNIKEPHRVPIIVSIIRNKKNIVKTYKFYSPDFARQKYEEEKTNIEQKFGGKILNKIKSKGKYILFDTISNKNIKDVKELKDDRI